MFTFRSIRLESLQHDPQDFGSTFEEESIKPFVYFADRLYRNTVLGGFVMERSWVQRNALKQNGIYYDQVLMVRHPVQ